MSGAAELRFIASRSAGEVSGLLVRPPGARRLLVLAHGAGAGMRHPFLERTAAGLAERGIATFRYQFPYAERGLRRPDPPPILLATVRAAVAAAGAEAAGLTIFAGGKSMGGRMTSMAAAEGGLPEVRGLVFLGFPLHAAGRPSTDRGDHLARVEVPMLFLQGTRDALADLELLRTVLDPLIGRATLHVVQGADHSFKVRKKDGRAEDDVMAEIAGAVDAWTAAR